MEAAFVADRYPGVSRLDLDRSADYMAGNPGCSALALDDDEIVGYVLPRSDDLTVHPAHRRLGHGRRLVEAGLQIVREQGLGALSLYVPEYLPGSLAFARALGFRRVASFWQFRLAADHAVEPPAFDEAVVVRPYRFDDLADLVALMNASFADHPSPVSWTEDDIRHRQGLAGFDPGDVLLAFPAPDRQHDADAAAPRPVGFCQVHLDHAEGDSRLGEVALVGVLPAWRAQGLGGALLRWGVARCRANGAGVVELTVEAANERALGIYRRAGFEPVVEWPHWRLPA